MAQGTYSVPSEDLDFRYNYASDTWKPTALSGNTDNRAVSSEKRSSSPLYEMIRSTIDFDTSTIPSYSLITGGSIQVYVNSLGTGLGSCIVYVCTHAGTGGEAWGSFTLTNMGTLNWGALSASSWWTIPLDITTNPITKEGTTRFALVSWHDYNNVTPPIQASSNFAFQSYGEANPTKLIVSYETGAGLDTTSKMW